MTAEETPEVEETAVELAPQQGDIEKATPTSESPAEWGSESLLRFVRDLQLAYQAANMLVSTSFVPASYNGKPQEAAAAMVTGQALGLDPLAALRSMDVIQGTPAFRAITIRAVVQAHGHEIWVEEQTSQRAIVRGRRRGSSKVETSMWDMDRARRMNLTGKPNWKSQPENMLLARATAEVGRLIAADALLGMAYSIEEIEDGVVPESAPVAEAKPGKTRTVSRRRTAAPDPEPVEKVDVPVEPASDDYEAAEAAAFDAAVEAGEVQP